MKSDIQTAGLGHVPLSDLDTSYNPSQRPPPKIVISTANSLLPWRPRILETEVMRMLTGLGVTDSYSLISKLRRR